jgi:hypothetical protein
VGDCSFQRTFELISSLFEVASHGKVHPKGPVSAGIVVLGGLILEKADQRRFAE